MDFIKSVSEGLSTLSNLAPYHMIGYSTLLGTTIYQTFVVTKVCYLELPMSAFTTLQKRLFPIYFRSQSLLLLCTALTIPPAGPVSLIQKKADWIPLALASVMAGFNLIVYGPRVEKTMIDRIHQETRDGTKYNDPEISDEMRAKNRAFSRAHAMSIHLNLIAVVATVWYGVRLASKVDFTES